MTNKENNNKPTPSKSSQGEGNLHKKLASFLQQVTRSDQEITDFCEKNCSTKGNKNSDND